MKLLRTALILTVALSSAACGIDTLKDLFTSPTEPTNNGEVRSYLGTWAGPTIAPAAQSCGSLMWKITSQSGSQASGDFSATCGDDVKLTGTMTATHGDTSIPWAVTGTATKGDGDVPLQHDRYRHLPGHVEYRGELRRHVVQRADERIGNDQAIVTSLFR